MARRLLRCWQNSIFQKFDAKKTSFFQSFQLIFDHSYFVRALAENNYKNKIENIKLVAKKKIFRKFLVAKRMWLVLHMSPSSNISLTKASLALEKSWMDFFSIFAQGFKDSFILRNAAAAAARRQVALVRHHNIPLSASPLSTMASRRRALALGARLGPQSDPIFIR